MPNVFQLLSESSTRPFRFHARHLVPFILDAGRVDRRRSYARPAVSIFKTFRHTSSIRVRGQLICLQRRNWGSCIIHPYKDEGFQLQILLTLCQMHYSRLECCVARYYPAIWVQNTDSNEIWTHTSVERWYDRAHSRQAQFHEYGDLIIFSLKSSALSVFGITSMSLYGSASLLIFDLAAVSTAPFVVLSLLARYCIGYLACLPALMIMVFCFLLDVVQCLPWWGNCCMHKRLPCHP